MALSFVPFASPAVAAKPGARRLAGLLAAAALALQVACATDQPWPEQVVSLDQMRFATAPTRTQWISSRADERRRDTTVVLHLHVDADGRIQRQVLKQSTGNPKLDEAAMQTLREARFQPHRGADGVAAPVTVVAVLRYPR